MTFCALSLGHCVSSSSCSVFDVSNSSSWWCVSLSNVLLSNGHPWPWHIHDRIPSAVSGLRPLGAPGGAACPANGRRARFGHGRTCLNACPSVCVLVLECLFYCLCLFVFACVFLCFAVACIRLNVCSPRVGRGPSRWRPSTTCALACRPGPSAAGLHHRRMIL